MSKRKAYLLFTVMCCCTALGAQGISLADFRVQTRGLVPEGTEHPLFTTFGSIAGRFVPASWIRLKTQCTLNIPDSELFFHPLPEYAVPGTLTFGGASAAFPALLGSPLNFTLFTGLLEDPSSDSLLRDLLKTEIRSPEFREKPAGIDFSPGNAVNGTGIALTAVPGNKNTVLGFYGYWNARIDSEAASSYDLRLAAAGSAFQLNAFGGITLEMNKATATMKGGLTALFGSGTANELYTEIGIKRYAFAATDNDQYMYFLFEPRLRWEKADLALSFFSAPVIPQNASGTPVAEGNYLGANILAGYGNLRVQKYRAGLSLLSSLDPKNPGTVTPFTFSVSPFFSFMISDFLFDITAVIKPLLYTTPYSMAEVMLSLKAVY